MNFSRLERITIFFTLLILAFLSGWFLSRQQANSLVFTPAAPSATVTVSPSPLLPESSHAPVEPININTADAALLQTLPGIGEKRATDIIAYRDANGPFLISEAISDVPGIGMSTLEAILPLITVGE